MLELGGNAADAAVAAGFAIAVVEPTMNSIGGRNQILVRTTEGEFHGIDGTTQAPWDYDHETAPRASFGTSELPTLRARANPLTSDAPSSSRDGPH